LIAFITAAPASEGVRNLLFMISTWNEPFSTCWLDAVVIAMSTGIVGERNPVSATIAAWRSWTSEPISLSEVPMRNALCADGITV